MVATACAHRPHTWANLGPTVRYHLAMQATFATQAPDGPASVQEALAPIATASRTVDMVLAVGLARQFRDDSLGYLVTFERVSDSADGQDAPTDLQGRSVELRRFGDGEILTVGLSEHVAGGDRQGEIFDLVFPLLSPFPPSLSKPGAAVQRAERWPLVAGPNRGWESRILPTWTWLDNENVLGSRAFHLSYEGPWGTKGRDEAHQPKVIVEAEGTVSGQVWYSRPDQDLLAHEFHWTRRVVLQVPGPDGGGLTVDQDQVFTGRLERVDGGGA